MKGRTTQVVVYTPERGTFTAATEGIAAARNFYSELSVDGADETLDDRITSHESSLATVLSTLRGLEDGEPAEAKMAAAFTTHLAVRNDHFRKVAASATTTMIDGIGDAFASADTARRLLGLDGNRPTGAFAQQLDEQFERFRPLVEMMGLDRAGFDAWAFNTAKANFDQFHEETHGTVDNLVAAIRNEAPDLAARAQRNALDHDLTPAERVECMAKMSWRIVRPTTALALPDCVAIGLDEQGESRPLILVDLDALDSVMVPIASDRLLVGTRSDARVLPPDPNAEAAACSWDFFVARDRIPELKALVGRFRSKAAGFVDDVVGPAVADAIAGLPTTD